ncbi:BC1872 family protein [Paenibacillus oleatilyticus]|uniref:BC1872 family protein n=1 Tax=Paenibacillus oleatilyticus TaxID=2594886 RepID=UPI001C1F73C0|nr:hypothetical protein [Paenibacillus oleatilyticus]MBU7320298.1 hypothetical protein [Paenibacillus oleatilyticus]
MTYTEQQIRDMKPYQLDLLVATEIMEFKYVPARSVGTLIRKEYYLDQDGEPRIDYSPSTDISAAWEVMEKMNESYWGVIECGMSKGSIRCAFGKYGVPNSPAIFADTAPEAICKAALLALRGGE